MKNISNSPRSVPALLDEIRTAPLSPDSIVYQPPQSIPSSSNICVPPPDSRPDGIESRGSNYILRAPNIRVEDEPDAPEFVSLEDLNWTDWDEVEKNRRLLDQGTQGVLRIAKNKKEIYPNGFELGNYFDNLMPIICSGYLKGPKIVYCGNTNLKGKTPCDQWSLCSKCAYVNGMKASEMYHGTFGKAIFFHITLGFDGGVTFDITNSLDVREYWHANEAAMRHLLKGGLIKGAFMSHELKILSLVPLRVNPHSHVIVTADAFPDELKNALADMIESCNGVSLRTSIEVKLIDSRQYHDKCIRYLTKAIELKEPYESAWQKLCVPDRSRAKEINLGMRNFLDAQAAAFDRFDRVRRMGNLMGQDGTFIGVPAKDRPSIIKRAKIQTAKGKKEGPKKKPKKKAKKAKR